MSGNNQEKNMYPQIAQINADFFHPLITRTTRTGFNAKTPRRIFSRCAPDPMPTILRITAKWSATQSPTILLISPKWLVLGLGRNVTIPRPTFSLQVEIQTLPVSEIDHPSLRRLEIHVIITGQRRH